MDSSELSAFTHDDKLRAAYALNLCTISVSQIIDYNDINILDQEYNSILNNLNLEQFPKDEALLDVLKRILDVITFNKISENKRQLLEEEYQHRVKNAIWTAIPNMGMIFATSNPVAMAVTLATQVGIGYMNYRRNKSEYALNRKKEELELDIGLMQQLNGLRQELFETAWRLADTYCFPDAYRLSALQIQDYNTVLMEPNPIKRFNLLQAHKNEFVAYPAFWYEMGSAANNVYRCSDLSIKPEIRSIYKQKALECFHEYHKLHQCKLLRNDILTSAWALEYIDLIDISNNESKALALQLANIALENAGNQNDVRQMCACAYLKLGQHKQVAEILNELVSKGYNLEINARILSGLYINAMFDPATADDAKFNYEVLSLIVDTQYMLPVPKNKTMWLPTWKTIEPENNEAAQQDTDTDTAESSFYEILTISSPIHIKPDETLTYNHKEIHFSSMIHCEGMLKLSSCIIHYNESEKADEIRISDTGNIVAENCQFKCHGYDNHYFIDIQDISSKEEAKEVLFSNCMFEDCHYFIRLSKRLKFNACTIKNPGLNFVYGDSSTCTIENSNIESDMLQYLPEHTNSLSDSQIYSFCVNLINCQIRGSAETAQKYATNPDNNLVPRFSLISASKGSIKSCNVVYHMNFLYGIDHINKTEYQVENTTFEYCFEVFTGSVRYSVNDCTFFKCSQIFRVYDYCKLEHCNFNDCHGELINDVLGGAHFSIDFCNFDKWSEYIRKPQWYENALKGIEKPLMLGENSRQRISMISFSCPQGKDPVAHYLSNCIFNDIQLENGWIINCKMREKYHKAIVEVDNCNFTECHTQRKDGKFFYRYLVRYPRFGTPKIYDMMRFSNCRGI